MDNVTNEVNDDVNTSILPNQWPCIYSLRYVMHIKEEEEEKKDVFIVGNVL